ncbi:DUF2817 domain-containing protein [Noviherbaspirillum sp. Root189]|uniref:DUF2817 domain-containing protein n=1 Tax=Noviherbaspirillum sp. Root189 TaxID=1736487 RepID=UPI00070A955F|nr:DUF2817 domain-containing protein [Noviherbaspirillum sp. Root189]KRB87392.1 hypothetical protein ASE07_19955 [Noviherbaspirillum sp. Root189]
MPLIDYESITIPSNYLDSRERFIAEGLRLGAQARCFYHASDAVAADTLTTDVVYLGARDAATLVIVSSGTHGVEGYAGAACQLHFMQAYRAHFEKSDIAYLLVHAVNPWGYLHCRRVTQEGVDLNRNFVDFPLESTTPSIYRDYHDILVSQFRPLPAGLWNELSLLSRGLTRHSRRQLQAAVTAGQYDCDDGLFYGGSAPTISRLVWEDIVRTYATDRGRVFLLDLHTGLGKRGAGELISYLPPDAADFQEMSGWFDGELRSMQGGESVSAAIRGTLTEGFDKSLDGQSYAVGLEFGTVSGLAVLNALRADQWCRNHAATVAPWRREQIRQRMKQAFVLDDEEWRRRVATRFDDVMCRLITGLSRTPANS